MPWGAVAGAVIGAVASNNASNKAAGAQNSASNKSIAEQQREYDLARQDQLPFLQAGYGALDRQNAALGGDWSGFYNSPDYAYALNQGITASDRSAAAHGALGSGGHSADLMALGQGLATQNFGNYWNRLAGMAGQGQTSASNLGQYGMNMANQIGNAYQNAGDARASSYLQQGNNWAGVAGAAGNAFGQWYGNRQYSSAPSNSWASGFGNNTGWLSDGSYGGGYGG